MASRINSSPVWNYMEKHGDYILCRLCRATFKDKQSTSNLVRHLKTRHPTEYKEGSQPVKRTTQSLVCLANTTTTIASAQPTIPATLDRLSKYSSDAPRKHLLDRDLLLMIVGSLHPFSLVEDKHFIKLVRDLDHKYEIPSRRHLMRTMLPELYDETKERVMQELMTVHQMALTTDIWTSRKTQGYLTVTCHFLTSDWHLKTYVLETKRLTLSHTAVNIAEELNSIMTEWNIRQKVCAVVTDNGANIVAAIEQLSLTQIPCFAHTLNLVVTKAIKNVAKIVEVQQKVKRIVNHFHSSVKSADKLEDIQKMHRREVKKLVQDVDTRFNSTYLMFERCDEEAEMINMALSSVGKNDLCLNNSEKTIIKEAILALKPYEMVSRELSAENFPTLSKVVPMIRLLHDHSKKPSVQANQLATELLDQLDERFALVEKNFHYAASSYLDPRFKQCAFSSDANVKEIERSISGLLTKAVEPECISDHTRSEQPQNVTEHDEDFWNLIDSEVSDLRDKSSADSCPSLTLQKYMQTCPVKRGEDPLKWWHENQTLLPNLQDIAKGLMCIPATSVPAERIFSKAGELISARRNNISASNANTILFLNKNYFSSQ